MAAPYARGRPTPRRIMCPKCGVVIDLSGEAVFSLAPKKPSGLEEVKALFSPRELEMLEIAETQKAYTIKPKIYLGRRAFKAISDVVRLAGGHFFSPAKKANSLYRKNRSLSMLERSYEPLLSHMASAGS